MERELYREMCNKHGKGKIWSLNPDELCDLIEEHLELNKGGD